MARQAADKKGAQLPRLLSAEEVAEVLGIPVRTIYFWRVQGVGPPGVRVGRWLRFDSGDVTKWLEERKEVRSGRCP